jgi:protocatechuate 3,4-dioxygenase beta subunit
MYLAGHPQNARDGLYRRLDGQSRDRVSVQLSPAPELEAGAMRGVFDIVLGVVT